MHHHLIIASIYASTAKHRAKQVAAHSARKVANSKSELICIGATTAVVGVTARVIGFNAGYTYAKKM